MSLLIYSLGVAVFLLIFRLLLPLIMFGTSAKKLKKVFMAGSNRESCPGLLRSDIWTPALESLRQLIRSKALIDTRDGFP